MVAKHKNSQARNSDMPSCKVLLLSKNVKSLDVIRREKNDMWFLGYTIQKIERSIWKNQTTMDFM